MINLVSSKSLLFRIIFLGVYFVFLSVQIHFKYLFPTVQESGIIKLKTSNIKPDAEGKLAKSHINLSVAKRYYPENLFEFQSFEFTITAYKPDTKTREINFSEQAESVFSPTCQLRGPPFIS